MPHIFICSTGNQAGQSLITWSIIRKLKEMGLKIGFFKPFGTNFIQKDGLWADQDVVLFKEVLGLEEPLDRLNPYPSIERVISRDNTEEILKNIKALCTEHSEQVDFLLIMGSNDIFFDNSAQPVPDIAIINELNGDCILVNRYTKSSASIYSIFSVTSLLKNKVKGIVINRVPPEIDKGSLDKMVATLTEKGIPITAILPEDPSLSYSTLREIKQVLQGELLCCEEEMGRVVGGMTVGSAYLQGDLSIFKRAYNKIILLKPSIQADWKESPLPKNIAGILLTGNVYPATQLVSSAKKTGIPLILTKKDTFSTIECLEKKTPVPSAEDIFKVNRFTELMDNDNAFDRLIKSLGILS